MKDLSLTQPRAEPQAGAGPKKGDYRDCTEKKGRARPKSDQESQVAIMGTLPST